MTAPHPPQSTPIDQTRLIARSCVASVEHHASIDSTNNRAKSLAREDRADLPRLVLADEQTAGRGRGSNSWWTGPGSLAFSLLVGTEDWKVASAQMPLTALAAGIAMAEAVSPRLPHEQVGLHWPNDLYVGERKLAGILVEMAVRNRLVVGIGVNTNNRLAAAPEALRECVATLIDLTGQAQDHTELLLDWLRGWETWIGKLADRADEIGRRADELCLQRGRTLCLRRGSTLDEGVCLGIAPSGALRLETDEGIREFHSGTLE